MNMVQDHRVEWLSAKVKSERGMFGFRAVNLLILIAFALLSSSFLSACAFAPVERPVIDQSQPKPNRYFKMSKDDLYEVCKITAMNMGYSIDHEDPAQGLIRTGLKKIDVSGNANCGTWNGSQINGRAASALEIKVKSLAENKSMVTLDLRIAARFLGRNLYGMVTRDETYRCSSLGQLENQFFSSVGILATHWKKGGAKLAPPVAAAPTPTNTQTEVKKASTPKAGGIKIPGEKAKLQKLRALKAMGLLSEAEFKAEKAKLQKD